MRGSTSRGQSTGSWVVLMIETIECSSVECWFGSVATGLDGVENQWIELAVLLTGLASWF